MNWKPNWPETRQHLLDWWNGSGLVVASWFPPLLERPHTGGVDAPWPQGPESREEKAINVPYRVQASRALCARHWPGLDCLPVADCAFGPGSLATMLGSRPEFTRQTIWFHPCWHELDDPEQLPPLTLDRSNQWFQLHDQLLRETRAAAGEDYAIGMPDLVEGIDILASLRDTNLLLTDLVERPEWVHEKLDEIHRIRMEVYNHLHPHCLTADGWTFHSSFRFGGPGRTDKIQCDLAAMISPAMFREFVMPHVREHCRAMDHTMFHLDGSECLDKLDDLLAIEELDAIEWSPDPKSGGSEHPRWHELFGRIRAAGKSVQAINLEVSQVAPLLDAVGPEGMFLLVMPRNLEEADELERITARYR